MFVAQQERKQAEVPCGAAQQTCSVAMGNLGAARSAVEAADREVARLRRVLGAAQALRSAEAAAAAAAAASTTATALTEVPRQELSDAIAAATPTARIVPFTLNDQFAELR